MLPPATEVKPLASKVALVTGASGGLGRAVAVKLAAAGAHVVLLARTVGRLEETDDAVRAAGGRATLCPLDLTRPGDLERALAAFGQRFGRLDILVSAAATLGALGPAHQITDDAWRRSFDTNLNAALRLIRMADPMLRCALAGRAVFATGYPAARAYWGAHAASKAGLEALVLAWAAETARTALRVNLVDPGPMRTRLRAAAYPGENPEALPSPDRAADLILGLTLPNCATHGEIHRP
ncbi:MAG: SDR family NAD(P)-dependent oxidoreductase [Alphaproteobacteria bacterium]|nr:SDR family NAD(P)-dependent oxidoreductase [Alphaproteobacteria bacterium]MCY4318907.1 SDR family NAD(P)-dependent oxidoreductase [Alphaproteobacteria bacterium]